MHDICSFSISYLPFWGFNKRVWLICTLKPSILKKISRKLKKLSILFQFPRNFFPKMKIIVWAHISKIFNKMNNQHPLSPLAIWGKVSEFSF